MRKLDKLLQERYGLEQSGFAQGLRVDINRYGIKTVIHGLVDVLSAGSPEEKKVSDALSKVLP
jgi:hypothetical protein